MTGGFLTKRPVLSATLAGKIARWAVVGVAAAALLWAYCRILPARSDWSEAYRPAALELLQGRTPYSVEPFYNPPWALVPLVPIALLPPVLGRGVLCLLSLAAFAIAAVRLGGRPASVAALLLSYPVVYCVIYGQIDGIVALGYVLPAPTGLFFVLMKPQLGMAAAVYWLVEAWRGGGLRQVARTFAPVAVAILLSSVFFGGWFLKAAAALHQEFNTSLWPRSLPIGAVLLVSAIRERSFRHAVLAGPFLSPYVAAHSWSAPILWLANGFWLVFAASAGSWLVWLLGGGPVDLYRP